MQTGRFTRWKLDSPAAAWYVLIFFKKFWRYAPKFLEKECPSPFAYFRNEFIKIPHERVKNGHLGSISPHMVTKIAEMFYTSRNRVRQSGENAPNFVSFSASSGVEFPFSAQKNKRTVSVLFRPAGGDMLFWDNDRVTPVTDTSYAVVHQTGRFTR